MVDKGLVSARQVGNVWEYAAQVRKADARRAAWTGFLDKAFGGATLPALEFVASESRLSTDEIKRLRALLDRMEDEDD